MSKRIREADGRRAIHEGAKRDYEAGRVSSYEAGLDKWRKVASNHERKNGK